MNRICNLAQNAFYMQRALKIKSSSNILKLLQHPIHITIHRQDAIRPGEDESKLKKKSKTSPKITLLSQNQSMSITTLEEAQKLAKRRDLHLMLVQELDTKTQRPVYKLVSQKEYLTEELGDFKSDGKSPAGKNVQKKSEKTLTIGSRISDHDLASRQKHICKWLTKQHDVRILIQGSPDDMSNMERIYKLIEQYIKEPQVLGKIQQKQSKGSHIKFNIVPIAPAVNTTETATESTIPSASKTRAESSMPSSS